MLYWFKKKPSPDALNALSESERFNLSFILDYMQIFLNDAVKAASPVSLEKAREYWSDDLVFYDQASPEPVRGIEAMIDHLAQIPLIYDDMSHVVTNIHVGEDSVAVNWTADAILKQPIMGSIAVGERVFASGTSRVKMRNQKIAEMWQVWTSEEVEKQLDFRQNGNEEAISKLTKRQVEVFEWLVQGKTNEEISMILGVSVRTVEKHCESIYKRLGIENRKSAMILGLLVED
tara:strand:+ start:10007 stop:10705 length:699 start_codon:yes stop_codon:yes gene_type:complete